MKLRIISSLIIIVFLLVGNAYSKEIYELQLKKEVIEAKDVELLTKTNKALQGYISLEKNIIRY